ncbi:MAG: hypothetical protein O0V67_05115 [Methanocorpusculum sp.]|nr:hypothetical protein [Methanocorpusculum sp.]
MIAGQSPICKKTENGISGKIMKRLIPNERVSVFLELTGILNKRGDTKMKKLSQVTTLLALIVMLIAIPPAAADNAVWIKVLNGTTEFQYVPSNDFSLQGYYFVPTNNPGRQKNPMFRFWPGDSGVGRVYSLVNERILKEDILSNRSLTVYGYGIAKTGRYAGKTLVAQLNSSVVIHQNDTFSVAASVYNTNQLACVVTQNNMTPSTAYSLDNFTMAPA